ncbi:MAG: 2-dehydro-3-deoxygalactonokinase [Rhizobiaceae bacterium]
MMLTQNPSCIAVDWGTSRLRLWALDGEGNVLAERRSEEGLEGVRAAGFNATLEGHIAAMGAGADVPVIICGMAGSRQGWVEAPYIATPTPLDAIGHNAVRIEETKRDVRILPGLAQHLLSNPQVMRGEETKLLGLGLDASRHLVSMPGTHAKWAQIDKGVVTGFTTFLTGELYALFSTRSILRHSVGENARFKADDPRFLEACLSMLEAPQRLTEKLFSIRAASLLFNETPDQSAATLSGLLIGAEVGSAKLTFGTDAHHTLAATGELGTLYAKAVSLAGFKSTLVDSEVLVRAGLFSTAKTFWPSRFSMRKTA